MLVEDLHLILKVAELKSITKAAEHFDMRVATASAAIKRVEAELGSELFIRTTRSLRLSKAGEAYLPQCEQALHMLSAAQLNLRSDNTHIEGELRIALSSDLGRNLANDWLLAFAKQHPELSLRVHLSDSAVDFYREAIDMGLRYGEPKESNLYGFKICEVPRLLVASPEYLARYGNPQTLDELKMHTGLLYQVHDVLHNTWQLSQQGKLHKVKMASHRIANDGDLVRRWAVAGEGIALKSYLDVAADLERGLLDVVMPEFDVPSLELWLVCPSRGSITPAVRLLRDHFRAQTQALLDPLNAQQS